MPGEKILADMAKYNEELVKAGVLLEARAEFERAASLTKNSRERALLLAGAHAR